MRPGPGEEDVERHLLVVSFKDVGRDVGSFRHAFLCWWDLGNEVG